MEECSNENHGHLTVMCSCGRILARCCSIADDFEEVRDEACAQCRLLRAQLEGR